LQVDYEINLELFSINVFTLRSRSFQTFRVSEALLKCKNKNLCPPVHDTYFQDLLRKNLLNHKKLLQTQ
jgi:hypothetical protein